MNIQQEADRIMKLNLKTKKQGDVIIEKFKKLHGHNHASELKQELQNRYKARRKQC